MARKSLAELFGGVTRFGKWTVVAEGPPRISGGRERRTATCQCDCGAVLDVLVQSIRSGVSRSCGCEVSQSVRDAAQRMGLANGKHRKSNGAEYRCWHAMRSRCLCSTDKAFGRYGGRGITICPEWNDFERFLADMGPRPSALHSVERLDNEKGYGPGNCAWRTATEQNRNRRNTVKVEHAGALVTLGELSDQFGIDYREIWRRIYRYGWSVDRAITTPVRPYRARQG